MIKTISKAAICAGAFALTGCMDEETGGAPQGIAGKDFVTFAGKDTFTTEGNWNSELDTYAWRLTVVNVDGFAAVCGVQSSNRVSARLMNQLMNDAYLSVNGVTLVQGFNHFRKVAEARSVDPGPAACKRGNVPWQPGMAEGKNWKVDVRGDGRYRA